MTTIVKDPEPKKEPYFNRDQRRKAYKKNHDKIEALTGIKNWNEYNQMFIKQKPYAKV